MAPVRRYLRITKYSVLECRIYLDNPALVQSWLLNPRDPILPRVIESVRPWVLPKLREERERSRKKSSAKKKAIKDVVVEDDFEVSIFLMETNTRHSILTKYKNFHDKTQTKLRSNTNKLIGATNDKPLDVDAPGEDIMIREEDEGEGSIRLEDVPEAPEPRRAPKRQRGKGDDSDAEIDEAVSILNVESDEEEPPNKRLREQLEDGDEDKKKMAMDVSYEGFSIYGRVLCLVVRKRENTSQNVGASKSAARSNTHKPEGQARMENWISSTQVPVGEDLP